jgi:hypothetical protein
VGSDVRPRGVQLGVVSPEVRPLEGGSRLRASDAARRRRFVVPRAFVVPDRAEQTTATLFCSR